MRGTPHRPARSVIVALMTALLLVGVAGEAAADIREVRCDGTYGYGPRGLDSPCVVYVGPSGSPSPD